MKKKKKFSPLQISLIAIATVLFIAIFAFYILIVCGGSKKLQTMWVCSAMTTMNHKYLATWFISDEKIQQIMSENAVDDSMYESALTDFKDKSLKFAKPTVLQLILSNNSKSVDAPSWFHSYFAEGYSKLEDGIYIKEYSEGTWKGFVMLIQDPLRVKLRDTRYQFDKGQTVKKMVAEADAIAGLNGGGFTDGLNYDSNGGSPAGLIIENGVLVFPKEYNDKLYNMIGINDKGVLILKHCTAQWAIENNIVSAVSFSPFLVVNGEGTVKNGTGGWGIAPRTAIGQRATGEFLFVVVDGRQIGWSIGCDLDVLQDILLKEKAENGAMLDGGSSTVLFYNGDYINRPSLGHERLINNCFIVTK